MSIHFWILRLWAPFIPPSDIVESLGFTYIACKYRQFSMQIRQLRKLIFYEKFAIEDCNSLCKVCNWGIQCYVQSLQTLKIVILCAKYAVRNATLFTISVKLTMNHWETKILTKYIHLHCSLIWSVGGRPKHSKANKKTTLKR